MKRLLIFMSILFGFALPALLPASALAIDLINPVCQNADPANLPAVCKDNKTDSPTNPIFGPSGILTKVINLLSLAVGIISVFVIIIGGIKMITSSGDPSSVTSARNTILYAVIALVITLAAQAAVRFILSKL